MLNEKRINEAENNVKSYLAEGLLKKTASDNNIIRIFIRNFWESYFEII